MQGGRCTCKAVSLSRGRGRAWQIELDPGRRLLTAGFQPAQRPQVCCVAGAHIASHHQQAGAHACHAVPIACLGLHASYMQLCPCPPEPPSSHNESEFFHKEVGRSQIQGHMGGRGGGGDLMPPPSPSGLCNEVLLA